MTRVFWRQDTPPTPASTAPADKWEFHRSAYRHDAGTTFSVALYGTTGLPVLAQSIT